MPILWHRRQVISPLQTVLMGSASQSHLKGQGMRVLSKGDGLQAEEKKELSMQTTSTQAKWMVCCPHLPAHILPPPYTRLQYDFSAEQGCPCCSSSPGFTQVRESYKGFIQTPLFSHPPLWCWTAFFNPVCPYILVSHNPFIQGSLVDSIPTATVMCPTVPRMSLPCCQWLYWLFERELENPFKELLPLTQ